MSVQTSLDVDLIGDFFKRDPGKTLYRNIGEMMDRLAPELERLVRDDLESRSGSIPGWTGEARDAVHGYTVSPKTGKTWALWAAVGVPNVGTRDYAVRVHAKWYGRKQGDHGTTVGLEQRFHPFRRVKSDVYRAKALISANLTKGIE